MIICGNDDSSKHPYKRQLEAEKPESVAGSLIHFKEFLTRENPRIQVKVIGLIQRPDVSRPVVQATNERLLEQIPECYVSPRDMRASGHFDWDDAHLNMNLGVFLAARLFEKRIIESLLRLLF